MPKFYSHRVNDCAGYLEHIYVDEGGDKVLLATLYDCMEPKGRYAYCHKWSVIDSAFRKSYATVADAKNDLFLALEWHLKQSVNAEEVEVLTSPPVLQAFSTDR